MTPSTSPQESSCAQRANSRFISLGPTSDRRVCSTKPGTIRGFGHGTFQIPSCHERSAITFGVHRRLPGAVDEEQLQIRKRGSSTCRMAMEEACRSCAGPGRSRNASTSGGAVKATTINELEERSKFFLHKPDKKNLWPPFEKDIGRHTASDVSVTLKGG